MSANPDNFGPVKPPAESPGAAAPVPGFPRPEHRDLETLLALSSLHQQIRKRRAQELNKGARLSSEDAWELKQLVPDEVLELVADRAVIVTGADGVAVALVDGDGLVCRASAGKIAPERGMRLDPGSAFSGACLRTGEVLRCDDSEKDNRVNPQACKRLGTRSMVAIPLSTPKAIIGVLEAFSTEAYGFNDSDVRSLMVLAQLILDSMKPEDENVLAEISQQVVSHDSGAETKAASSQGSQIGSVEQKTGNRDNGKMPETTKNSDWTFQIKAPVLWQEEPAAPKSSAKLVFIPDADQAERSRPGLRLVFILMLVATALGVALWWQIRLHLGPRAGGKNVEIEAAENNSGKKNVSNGAIAQSAVNSAQTALTASPTDNAETAAAGEASQKPARPEITGIRHWSSADSSTVVIDLGDEVQYEAHRLTAPERIYFDLLDTTVEHGLPGPVIEVNDGLLERIRIAQPKPGITRVVLDTQGASNYAVSLESNPYRLVVEVGRLGSKLGPKAKLKLFAPADEEEASANPGKSTGETTAAPAAQSAKTDASNNPPQLDRSPKLSIVLDAGHGGWDLGTVGKQGLQEKDLVLDITQRLGGLLRRRLNASVVYTRQDDSYIPLEKRAEIANLSRAQLFLSIHANYSDSTSARGVETYYSSTYSSLKARPADDGGTLQNVNWTKVDIREKVHDSHRLAESVQESLFGTIAAKNPGIRDRGVKEADYVVLTGTSMPAILAEISFVSSPTDENELQTTAYRQNIAEALYKGIARYEEATRHATMAGLVEKPAAR